MIVSETKWAKQWRKNFPHSNRRRCKEAYALAKTPGLLVEIYRSDTAYVIEAKDTEGLGFWMGLCVSYQEAIDLCEEMGWVYNADTQYR